MVIYVGSTHTAQVEGDSPIPVRCEACGYEYVYMIHRVTQGVASNPYYLRGEGAAQAAEKRAHEKLAKALLRGCEVVPCPECGHIQQPMARLLRARARMGMKYLAWTCFWLALLALVIVGSLAMTKYQDRKWSYEYAMKIGLVMPSLVLAGWLVLLVLRMLLNRGLNPNAADVHLRRLYGGLHAISQAEFDALRAQEMDAPEIST